MSQRITDVKQIDTLLSVSHKKTWITLSVMLVFTVAFVVFLLSSHITFTKEYPGYIFPQVYEKEEYLDHMMDFLTAGYTLEDETIRLLREKNEKNITAEYLRSLLFITAEDDPEWIDEGMTVTVDEHKGHLYYASSFPCSYDEFVSDFGQDAARSLGYYPGDSYYVYMCLVNDGDELDEGACPCTVILDEIALGSFIFE